MSSSEIKLLPFDLISEKADEKSLREIVRLRALLTRAVHVYYSPETFEWMMSDSSYELAKKELFELEQANLDRVDPNSITYVSKVKKLSGILKPFSINVISTKAELDELISKLYYTVKISEFYTGVDVIINYVNGKLTQIATMSGEILDVDISSIKAYKTINHAGRINILSRAFLMSNGFDSENVLLALRGKVRETIYFQPIAANYDCAEGFINSIEEGLYNVIQSPAVDINKLKIPDLCVDVGSEYIITDSVNGIIAKLDNRLFKSRK